MNASDRRQSRCYRTIEDALSFVRKKDDVPAVMQCLKTRFQSPGAVLESNVHQLTKEPLSESEAQFLALIPSITRYALRSQTEPHPKLDRLSAAVKFLRPLFIGISIEQFYLLALDDGGRLIQHVLLQKGTIDETPFYIGHVLQHAITTGAKALVLCHNHPGGTLRPSEADLRATARAIFSLSPLSIPLLDHIIIAGDHAVSIRSLSFIDQRKWVEQDPDNPLIANWIDISLL